MTKWQEIEIKRILKWVEEHDLYKNDPDHEIKIFETQETDYGTVIVYIESGLKNDAGTMAAVLCRTRRHIFIGPKGGLKCYKHEKGHDRLLKGWTNVMIFGADY